MAHLGAEQQVGAIKVEASVASSGSHLLIDLLHGAAHHPPISSHMWDRGGDVPGILEARPPFYEPASTQGMNPCGALDLLFFSYDYFEPNMCALSLNILLEKLTKLLKFTSFLILRANIVILMNGGARKQNYLWVCWAVRHKSKSSSKRGLSLTHKKGVQSRPQYPLLSSPFIGTCFADKESGTCNVSKTLLAKIIYEQDFLYCRCPNWLSSPK